MNLKELSMKAFGITEKETFLKKCLKKKSKDLETVMWLIIE